MKVVDLHPEELLDKKEQGTLTPAEALRLEAHLAQCAACRFEIGARADFSAELEEEEALEVAERSNAPLGAPPIAKVDTIISKRRARRSAMVLLAAAAVLVAGVGWGSWREGGPRALFIALTSPAEPAPSTTEPVIPRAAPHRPTGPTGTEATESVQTASSGASAAEIPVLREIQEPVVAPALSPVVEGRAMEGRVIEGRGAAPARENVPRAGHRTIGATSRASIVPERTAPVAELAAVPVVPPPVPAPEAAPVAFASAASLFDAANGARAHGDRDRAIALYHDLQMRFAGTTEARVSRVTLGRFLLDGGDANGALRAFDTALRDRPGELEEEALVGRALALRRLGRDADEAAAWTALLSAYPTSPHAARARARIATLAR